MADTVPKPKKKTYTFDIRKKYQYVGHFKVKERPPIEMVKEKLSQLLKPKKVKTPLRANRLSTSTTPSSGGFNMTVLGSFLLIAVIILGFGWFYISSQLQQSVGPVTEPQISAPSLSNSILAGRIISAGDKSSPQYSAAVMLDYSGISVSNYSIILTPYRQRIPSEVFILDSDRFEASSYYGFANALRSDLAKRKIILNELSMKQLETMPQGAIVVLPSGLPPKELLGFDSQINMNKLVEKGIIVIYVGQAFTKMINGSSVMQTPKSVLDKLPVKFDESNAPVSEPNFNLFQPLYRAVSNFGWKSTISYGSVSIVQKGDGAFVFVPQTLDGGWRGDADKAAEDISTIIFETPWAEPMASPKVYSFSNQTSFSGKKYFITDPFDSQNCSVKIEFIGTTLTSKTQIRQTLVMYVNKELPGDMYLENQGKVVPSNITGNPVRINAELREAESAQPNMYVTIKNQEGQTSQVIPQGPIDTQSTKSLDPHIYVNGGEYIVQLNDDVGRVYAESYMHVVSLDVISSGNDQKKKSIYLFDILMDSNPYKVNEVSVSVDGGKYGNYKFQNTNKLAVDVGSYTGGEFLPQGKHTFTFTVGSLNVVVNVDHIRPKTIFDEPFFWIMMLLTLGFVAVGILFARQDIVSYSLDIPDFPPIARTKIPLLPDVVLSIFDKVNESYKWESTPLTPSEIKNGFKTIFYQGKSVYITDYNVEYLLEDLVSRGLVRESLGYYGLAAWEKKRSIEYLALMRRIRDICVNNAVPFTQIDESPEADTVVTVVGQQMFVHFYEKTTNEKILLSKLLKTMGRGISIVFFANPSDKEAFQRFLNSSTSTSSLIVKMEAEGSSMLLVTPEELENMLVEFKSI